MTDSSLRAALQWSSMQMLNRERFDALMRVFGSLEEAIKHVDCELLRGLGCREETSGKAMQRLEKCDLEQEMALLTQAGASLTTLAEPEYPDRLKDIPDCPIFLYARGNLSILHQPCVALVGTRRMSGYGKRVAEEFTRALAKAKIVTVSGLARGIDSLVARETMEAGSQTVAVLGQGLLTLSPDAKELADSIVNAGGLVLSEFPLRMGPDIFTFPLRNRIIAGLSLATVVLEAPERSGALITAKLAFDYNRDVFAVPGQIFDINYAGCHALIARQQARITSSPRDVLEDLGVIVPDSDAEVSTYIAQSPEEEKVLQSLTTMPSSVDALVEKSAVSAASASAILTVLELNGAAKNLGGSQWIKL